jgi:leader peptidase (prepilin peptidase)/N-methyltransferase
MDLINFIIYLTIAISGTVFGSFFTLAVHRIPRHEDITHERSYCPKCNHKLHFLDLIPVFSYIFLGGKCRYCKAKIRPRYLILELCSGLAFVLMALARKISIDSSPMDVALFIVDIMFLCALYIIAGINKEHLKIPRGLLIYALIIACVKLILDTNAVTDIIQNGNIIENVANVVLYALYAFIIPISLYLVNYMYVRLSEDNNDIILFEYIQYIAILGLFFGFQKQIIGTIAATILGLIVYVLAKKEKDIRKIPFGFLLSCAFTVILILGSLINF